MNKLVSRNPVQRFKQGKKLLFAKPGDKMLYNGGKEVVTEEILDGQTIYRRKDGSYVYPNKLLSPIKTYNNVNSQQQKYNPGWISNINSQIQNNISNIQKFIQKPNQKESTIQPSDVNGNKGGNSGKRTSLTNNRWVNGIQRKNEITDVRATQQMLKDAGFDIGKYGVDGRWGKDTERAYNEYLQKNAPILPTSEQLVQQVTQNTPVIEEVPQAGTNTIQNQLTEVQKVMPATGTYIMNPTLPKLNRSDTRWVINDALGKNAYNFTGVQRKALRQYLNGEQYNANDLAVFGNLDIFNKYKPGFYKKGGNMILPSRNIVERFKQGRKIDLFQEGGNFKKKRTTPIKRFRLSASDNSFSREFDTEEQARAYRKQHNIVGRITDQGNSWKGQVVKADRTRGKDAQATAYGRQQTEKYNNLSFKEAYRQARNSGNKYFAYKGKVYKSDLQNGKDNMTEMQGLYGTHLGYSKDPKLQNASSRAAREQYRKDTKASNTNRNANYQGKTNKQVSSEADKQVAKTWDEAKFVDALMPIQTLNLPLMAMDKDYKPEIYRSGLNPLGYAQDAVEGNLGGLATRALDAYTAFGAPGSNTLITKMAPKIPVPTYLQKLYHGDAGSTNWVINGLNRASGKAKNFFTRIVPRKGNGLYGKYSIQSAEHIDPRVTAVVNNKTNQYITGNPEAIQPLYTHFGNLMTNPKTWTTLDITNQYSNNNYE